MKSTLTLIAFCVIAPGIAKASTCSLKYDPDKIRYWTNSSPEANSTRCDWKNGNPTCNWYGWLWKNAAKTSSTGNLPAVIVVHGSGATKTRSYFCEQVNRLVDSGYVVFMPFLRGVDDNSTSDSEGGWRSTGTYIEDYANANSSGSDSYALATLSYMKWQAEGEVQFALTKLTSLTSGDGSKPLVSPSKIALMGHSYGGMTVTIAASVALSPQPAAALDLSGGVMSWGSSIFWAVYKNMYAAAHKSALYLQQTVNESPSNSVDSTLQPFLAANNSGGLQMGVWDNANDVDPTVQQSCDDNGYPKYQCRHIWFFSGPKQVDRWWGTAMDFMTRHGVK